MKRLCCADGTLTAHTVLWCFRAGSREPVWVNVTDEGQDLHFISPSSFLLSASGFGEEKEGNNSAVEIKGRKIISFSRGGCWENHINSAPTLQNQLTRGGGGLQHFGSPVKKTNPSCTLTHCDTFPLSLSLPSAAVLLGAGRALRGGGARPQAAGAPGRGREEEPAAEGARPEGEALPEERPQGRAQGRAGGPGAAGEAEGRAAQGGAPHQRHNAGGAPARALLEHGATPGNATLTDPTCSETATHPGLNAGCGERERERERLLGGLHVRDKQIATVTL